MRLDIYQLPVLPQPHENLALFYFIIFLLSVFALYDLKNNKGD